MDLGAIKFAYNDYKRRKKDYDSESNYKPALKIFTFALFVIAIAWMIHDLIKFSK